MSKPRFEEEDLLPTWINHTRYDEHGEPFETEERITAVIVQDDEGNELHTLDVEDCQTYGEMRLREIEWVWEHNRSEGYSPQENAAILRRRYDRWEAPRRSLAIFLDRHQAALDANRY